MTDDDKMFPWLLALAVVFVIALQCVVAFGDDHPAVVKIKGGCTAVCVSPAGLIMTAKHCGTSKNVTVDVGGREVAATLVYVGKDAGDAPVVYDMDGDGYAFVPVGSKVPSVGDAVYCVGYPGGDTENKVVMKGKLLGGKTCDHGVTGNVVDFQTMRGMSGCPLFNAAGEVIGLLHGGEGSGSLYLGCGATRKAYEAAGGKDEPVVSTKPTLYVFTLPDGQCGACDAFKTDEKAGRFDRYEVQYVTFKDGVWDRPGVAAALRAATKKTAADTPTFWPQGSSDVKVGYRTKDRNAFIAWLDGIVRALIRLPEAVVGIPLPETPPAPPPSVDPPQPAPGTSTPLPDAEVDWSAVTFVALASDATPKLARFLKGPAKRAVETLSKGKAALALVVVAERTEPTRYQAVVDAANVNPNPLFLLVLAEKQHLGLKGLVVKVVEGKAAEFLGEHEKLPVEVIFQRTHKSDFAAIKAAIETVEPSPFVRAEESVIEPKPEPPPKQPVVEQADAEPPADEPEDEDVPWWAGLVAAVAPLVKLWKGRKGTA